SNTKEFALDSGSFESGEDEDDADSDDNSDSDADDDSGDGADDVDAELSGLIDSYETELVNAVNGNDFGLVAPYLLDGSALYEAQDSLVDHLNESGVTEELLDYDIVDTSCDGDTCTIDVDETVEITYESGDVETQDYNWTYTAEKDGDGSFKLSEIKER